MFAERLAAQSRRWARAVPLEPRFADLRPDVLLTLGPQEFAALAARVFTPREPPSVPVTHIHQPKTSVAEQAVLVVAELREHGTLTFTELTRACTDTFEIVARSSPCSSCTGTLTSARPAGTAGGAADHLDRQQRRRRVSGRRLRTDQRPRRGEGPVSRTTSEVDLTVLRRNLKPCMVVDQPVSAENWPAPSAPTWRQSPACCGRQHASTPSRAAARPAKVAEGWRLHRPGMC